MRYSPPLPQTKVLAPQWTIQPSLTGLSPFSAAFIGCHLPFLPPSGHSEQVTSGLFAFGTHIRRGEIRLAQKAPPVSRGLPPRQPEKFRRGGWPRHENRHHIGWGNRRRRP